MKHLYLTRKVLSTLFLLVLAVGSVKAQYGTPKIDGVINDEDSYDGSIYSGNIYNSGSAVWRMTWDAKNVYFAISNANTTAAAVVYIDSDPLPIVNGGNNNDGSLSGVNYDGVTGLLPFRADRAIYFKDGYQERQVSDGSGSWTKAENGNPDQGLFVGPYAKSFDVREIAIPWSKINKDQSENPKPFNWFGFITNPSSGNANSSEYGEAFASIPFGNPAFGNKVAGAKYYSPEFIRYFTVNNVSDGNVNDSGDNTAAAFSRQSYTHIGGNITDFGAIEVYDFTINKTPFTSSSIQPTITRASNSGPWQINGSLVVGTNSTLNAGGSNSTIAVTENFLVADGGTFSQGDSRLTVAGNFSTPGTFNAGSQTLVLDGTTPQDIVSVASFNNVSFTNVGQKNLTNNLSINGNISVGAGAILNTTNYTLELQPGSRLNEANSGGGGYVLGYVRAQGNLSTPNAQVIFNNIGLRISPSGTSFETLPGSTTVLRRTGFAEAGPNNSKSITRQYKITPTNNKVLASTLIFGYRDSYPNQPATTNGELNGIPESQLRVFRSEQENTPPYERLGGTVNASDNTVTITGEFSLNGYFTLGDGNAPLPVELVAFTGQLEGSAVRLNWATASEKNNKGFEVQRSTGGDQWFTLGFVAGNGSTSQRNAYAYRDANAPEGKAYYRLRQLDNDGTESFSPVVTIAVPAGNAPALVLSPVPTPDVLNISGLGSGAHVAEVYDMMGKRVLTHSFTDQTTSVSVANLPSGLYVVQVQGKKSKFVKQ
ncbi:T9SS type A sorting domain-containing protein [Hymenobacter defluvii]|uniref:T9SS type A sorting domain-containing protein n=1 Tax=Hymenobacter defluvii TaxID=2054411 RepID=A0ABS3TEB8_9BACT|nr:T9SS type A sorting domain-containing protein [Hymenobacter defluvii]MBO3272000.1 T9SS type A sorting domain-containing protein [Hymenobacter defluvii]